VQLLSGSVYDYARPETYVVTRALLAPIGRGDENHFVILTLRALCRISAPLQPTTRRSSRFPNLRQESTALTADENQTRNVGLVAANYLSHDGLV